MTKKTTIIFGIILVLILICVAYPILKKTVPVTVGGTSMYDSTSTFSQGLIVSGKYDMGRISSASSAAALTAAQFCRSNWVTIDPTLAENEDTLGASVSLPTEALLIADCLPNVGSCKSIFLENMATESSALDVVSGDSDITSDNLSSESTQTIDYNEFAELEACMIYSTPLGVAADTASLSWSWYLHNK